jgi:hypothetical protein
MKKPESADWSEEGTKPNSIAEILVARGTRPLRVYEAVHRRLFGWHVSGLRRISLLINGVSNSADWELVKELANSRSSSDAENCYQEYRINPLRSTGLFYVLFCQPSRKRVLAAFRGIRG